MVKSTQIARIDGVSPGTIFVVSIINVSPGLMLAASVDDESVRILRNAVHSVNSLICRRKRNCQNPSQMQRWSYGGSTAILNPKLA